MNRSDSAIDVLRRNKKYGAIGVLTVALIWYERYRKQKIRTPPEKDNGKKPRDYIYIDLNVYKEFLYDKKQKEELEKKWLTIITNPIEKWWKSAKHTLAWRLLHIAQSGSHSERLKAVRQLACVKNLKDWDFRHLAQLCDARTAVSLARCGADSRWHLPISKLSTNQKLIPLEIQNLLREFCAHDCVTYFLKKKKKCMEEFWKIDQNTPLSQDNISFLKDVIILLLHITNDTIVANQLIAHGLLTSLMKLRKIFQHDFEAQTTICKVLSNLSLVPNCVNDFFVSGWIGMLNHWQSNGDMRLKVISSKTLANLDYDDPHHVYYAANIYPLHPRMRTRIKPQGDLVLIHGLLGGVFITWRQKDSEATELSLYGPNSFYTSYTDDMFNAGEISGVALPGEYVEMSGESSLAETEIEDDLSSEWEIVYPDVPLKSNDDCDGDFSVPLSRWKAQGKNLPYTNCWPMEWLPEDCPKLRIIGVDFMSAITDWTDDSSKFCPCEKNATQMDTRASLLLSHIVKADIGNKRPVIWISHSLGGLLTKIMILKSNDSKEIPINQIAKNTRAIAFLGTPHKGSPMAKWNNHMQLLLCPSIEVKEMEEGSHELLTLHSKFMNELCSNLKGINILSIIEGMPTMLTSLKFPLTIVTEDSGTLHYGDYFILKEDHLSLSKPALRQSFLYQRLLLMIRESLKYS